VAPRPYWKGHLKLSLVSCPIALHTATKKERTAFRQINKQTGNRLRQRMVDEYAQPAVLTEPAPKKGRRAEVETDTFVAVHTEDKGRGYEVAPNTFVSVEDDELARIAIDSTHTIEIDSFVPRAQIDMRYFDGVFYVTPTDSAGHDAFAVIREAMRDEDKVGIGRVVLNKRERMIMLQPWERGLIATTLRYASEVRDTKDYFGDIPDVKVPAEMLKLARRILSTMSADFEPHKFVDRYEQELKKLLASKQAIIATPNGKAKSAPPTNVVNLMDALRKSVAQERNATAEPRPRVAAASAKAQVKRSSAPRKSA
jgi:DNA end-binding protein Ku